MTDEELLNSLYDDAYKNHLEKMKQLYNISSETTVQLPTSVGTEIRPKDTRVYSGLLGKFIDTETGLPVETDPDDAKQQTALDEYGWSRSK